MNDEQRAALVEVIEAELDSYCPSPFNGAFAVSLMQIIDRLLTDRAAPEPGLDELLDSVNPEAIISFVFQHDSEPWIAGIRWPYTDELSIDSQTFARAEGTGPTRMAAITDAVRQAKENGDEAAKGTEGSA